VTVERIGVVLAAGGERVVPWESGVLAGLAEGGLDLRGAGAIVGTSAGAFVAARLALGVDPREAAERIGARGVPAPPAELVERAAATLPRLLEIQAAAADLQIAERRRRVGRFTLEARTIPEDVHVAAITSRLPAGDWPAALRIMVVDAETGELVRLDRRAGISVGRGVAAARALPGVLPAITVGRRRLIDAVVASGTNADAARGDVERVIVITPAAAEPRPGTVDAALEAGLARERAALDRAGVAVHVVRADDEARAAMGEQLYGIVDAGAAVDSGRRAGRAVAAALPRGSDEARARVGGDRGAAHPQIGPSRAA
jgi:NTE family protein